MQDNLLDNLLNLIPSVGNREYVFLRSDSGDSFTYFTENNIIGIGWNEISLHEIINSPEDVLKAKIFRLYYQKNNDYTEMGKKTQATSVYNKLKKFNELKKGDVVVVPSEKSDFLAFGIIDDNTPYNSDESDLNQYGNIKRRRVVWKKIALIQTLDSIFWMVKSNMHSLSSIKKYSEHIDAILEELYFSENNLHQIINIRTSDKIGFSHLTELLELHKELLFDLNQEFNLREDDKLNGSFVRLSLNSPGLINIAIPICKSAILFSFLIALNSCEDPSKFGRNAEINNSVSPSTLKKFGRYKELKDSFDAQNEKNYFTN